MSEIDLKHIRRAFNSIRALKNVDVLYPRNQIRSIDQLNEEGLEAVLNGHLREKIEFLNKSFSEWDDASIEKLFKTSDIKMFKKSNKDGENDKRVFSYRDVFSNWAISYFLLENKKLIWEIFGKLKNDYSDISSLNTGGSFGYISGPDKDLRKYYAEKAKQLESFVKGSVLEDMNLFDDEQEDLEDFDFETFVYADWRMTFNKYQNDFVKRLEVANAIKIDLKDAFVNISGLSFSADKSKLGNGEIELLLKLSSLNSGKVTNIHANNEFTTIEFSNVQNGETKGIKYGFMIESYILANLCFIEFKANYYKHFTNSLIRKKIVEENRVSDHFAMTTYVDDNYIFFKSINPMTVEEISSIALEVNDNWNKMGKDSKKFIINNIKTSVYVSRDFKTAINDFYVSGGNQITQVSNNEDFFIFEDGAEVKFADNLLEIVDSVEKNELGVKWLNFTNKQKDKFTSIKLAVKLFNSFNKHENKDPISDDIFDSLVELLQCKSAKSAINQIYNMCVGRESALTSFLLKIVTPKAKLDLKIVLKLIDTIIYIGKFNCNTIFEHVRNYVYSLLNYFKNFNGEKESNVSGGEYADLEGIWNLTFEPLKINGVGINVIETKNKLENKDLSEIILYFAYFINYIAHKGKESKKVEDKIIYSHQINENLIEEFEKFNAEDKEHIFNMGDIFDWLKFVNSHEEVDENVPKNEQPDFVLSMLKKRARAAFTKYDDYLITYRFELAINSAKSRIVLIKNLARLVLHIFKYETDKYSGASTRFYPTVWSKITEDDKKELKNYYILAALSRKSVRRSTTLFAKKDILIMLREYIKVSWKSGSRELEHFSNHGLMHIDKLIKLTVNLQKAIFLNPPDHKLRNVDWFIVAVSIIIHDIGMLDDEQFFEKNKFELEKMFSGNEDLRESYMKLKNRASSIARENHGETSEIFARKWLNALDSDDMNKESLNIATSAAAIHNGPKILYRLSNSGDTLDNPELFIVSFIDSLDLGWERIERLAKNIGTDSASPLTKGFWIKDLLVNSSSLKGIFVSPKVFDEKARKKAEKEYQRKKDMDTNKAKDMDTNKIKEEILDHIKSTMPLYSYEWKLSIYEEFFEEVVNKIVSKTKFNFVDDKKQTTQVGSEVEETSAPVDIEADEAKATKKRVKSNSDFIKFIIISVWFYSETMLAQNDKSFINPSSKDAISLEKKLGIEVKPILEFKNSQKRTYNYETILTKKANSKWLEEISTHEAFKEIFTKKFIKLFDFSWMTDYDSEINKMRNKTLESINDFINDKNLKVDLSELKALLEYISKFTSSETESIVNKLK